MIFLMLLVALLVLAACGMGEKSEGEETPGDNAAEPTDEIEEEEPLDSDAEEAEETEEVESDEEVDPSEESESEDPAAEKITETGIYNGQADPHTIEIETENGPTAFQLTMDARDDIEQLTVGEEVTYTYLKDGEQLVIESINPK